MKQKIVYILILLACSLNTVAQKKEISQAKANIKSGKNLEQTEQSMRKILADSTQRDNEKVWLLLFEAVKKQYEQGNEKLYLKQQYDTAQLFVLTRKMFEVLEGFDSLDAKPNSKGKSAPVYRKRHAEFLHQFRPNLYNGGIFFANKQKYQDAYHLLDLYLDCARQPLFQQYNYAETDNKLSEAAYWAVFCGYKLQNPKATLHHVYQALKDTTHYCLMLQYLAETYKLENDTTRWVETLQEGFSRYPLFPFFFPRLISYYGEKGDWNKVETISDEALKADSTKQTFLFAKSTALLNLSRLNECVEVSERIIKADSLFPDAYYNAGLAYYNRAEQLNKKLQQSAKTKNEIKANYKKAMPYLQRYRALKPDDSSQWLMPLYNIYLNLNMGKEFDEVDRLMRTKK
ncbi:MAG: hypothetical protein J5971_05785 [Prevotella sp.]|nr:hypothetical protein [Prevotella sp.]